VALKLGLFSLKNRYQVKRTLLNFTSGSQQLNFSEDEKGISEVFGIKKKTFSRKRAKNFRTPEKRFSDKHWIGNCLKSPALKDSLIQISLNSVDDRSKFSLKLHSFDDLKKKSKNIFEPLSWCPSKSPQTKIFHISNQSWELGSLLLQFWMFSKILAYLYHMVGSTKETFHSYQGRILFRVIITYLKI